MADGPDFWWSASPPSGPDRTDPDDPVPIRPTRPDPVWERPDPRGWDESSPGHGELLSAAEAMRDAAEVMRDAATPAAPEPGRNWDFSWITLWLRTSEHGIACKRALYSSGPATAVALLYYQASSHADPGGAALLLVLLAALGNAVIRSAFSRWVMWGTILGPLMYPPALLAIMFDLAQVLF